MGIFFDDIKPNVSKDEFKKVRSALYSKGWKEKEIDLVTTFFSTSLIEANKREKGIDKAEIDQAIKSFRDNEDVYHLSESKLLVLEEVLRRYI